MNSSSCTGWKDRDSEDLPGPSELGLWAQVEEDYGVMDFDSEKSFDSRIV